MTAAAQPLILPGFALPRTSLWMPAEPAAAPSGDPDGLRPYQREAVTAIGAELSARRSTLLVMATGLGKTQTFGAVAKHWPGRVLVLSHRDELIDQAAKRLRQMTGEFCGIEQAAQQSHGERLVSGSVQSLCRSARLARFPQDAFGLVIVDEAHHAVAATYRRILDYFSGAKLLGVTATPDRQDRLAMGQIFQSVAYERTILQGQADGFLCPVIIRRENITSIDLSMVGTVAGDLNQGQLDEQMSSEKTLIAVIEKTLEHAGARSSIVFTTSVANAHRMAEIFNDPQHRPGSARAVDGGTDALVRRDMLKAHQRGDFQFLINVGIATEGYDDPGVSCVVMGRPTKSRALYTQCIGRGLRPAPGKVDCLVIDVAGNSGRHTLVSAIDILAGKYSDAAAQRAKKASESNAVNVETALADAERDIAAEEAEKARRAAIRASVKVTVKSESSIVDPFGDPFALYDIDRGGAGNDSGQQPADVGAIAALRERGAQVPRGITKTEAARLLRGLDTRKRQGLASPKMVNQLSRRAIPAAHLKFEVAKRLMAAVEACGWKRPEQAVIDRIINAGRVVGEEG